MLSEEKEVGPFIIKLTAQQVFADYTVQLEVIHEGRNYADFLSCVIMMLLLLTIVLVFRYLVKTNHLGK